MGAGVTISNVSVSPSYVTFGETMTVSFKVTNTSGEKILKLQTSMVMQKKDFDGVGGSGSSMVIDGSTAGSDGYTVNLANGAALTMNYVFSPNAMQSKFLEWQAENPGVHAVPLYLNVSALYKGDVREYTRVNVTMLADRRYTLRIDGFDVARSRDGVVNDEGENILTDLNVTLDEDWGADKATMLLYYAEGDVANENDDMLDLTALIPQAQAGLTASDVIAQQFSNGSDWALMLVLSNGLESVSVRTTLARAFANVHLSGASTGGVALGKFSAAEEGKPLFECAYPARMLGGIEGVNLYSEDEVLTGGVWIDGKPLYRKLLVITSTATGTWSYDISDLNHDYIRVVSDMIQYKYNNNAYIYWAQGGFYSGEENYHRVFVRDSALRIGTGAYIHRQVEYVLLEYTKAD